MNVKDLINQRRLINGPKDKLMCVNPLKHKWAWEMLDTFEKNTWFPKSIAMGRDIQDYKERLDDAERNMFDKATAFLSNLDGIQFDNLITNIGSHITSPEVSMCIARQAYEEANHVRAYATIIEAVSLDPLKVYGMYETDDILAKKNAFIMAQSAALGEGEFTAEKFALAVIGNIVLEGIYFFSGFYAFYLLAKNGKMLGSADQIKYIERDELGHLELFIHMFHTLQVEEPQVFTPAFKEKALNIIRQAVELETAWGKHIISGGVLGATDAIITERIKYLANLRVARLGWEPLYPNVKNPTPWVEKISAINGVESNFFEARPTDYQAGGALEWDI
ncbi:ribonucleotide-diphosphate reductase subunit beta [Undibacterium sp. 5I1]|uniref:ribonucleotide-diphosphate reductase subunit beta n=1 Tax=unclassified Undibacterium TaxID=2630295 RepID=UPI002AB5915A|nr:MULTISPECIES: ribonucleotide-diphosphate reductase subunit beta [unclassified Undibacterium]MDY7537543.1 ribonucleotide-diphosphate reductase subunit beta [Undibacterium sp. 5I1]MEB0231927.1 ribonucleotide-diphosphate reductase subunit beta [Undibacterium sp. 10I3]MEB0256278.1 ribonucleotide-diphosphate reductase subunit beta [Undibacterium sp. 5I1]